MPATATTADWMPTTWGGKREMFVAVRDQLSTVRTELGLSNQQVTDAQDLCIEAIAVIDYYNLNHAAASGLTEWRDNGFTGPQGGTLDVPPTFTAFVMPTSTVTGILAVFRKRRDQWVSSDGYTEAIGETLKIATPGGSPLDPGSVTPLIAVSPAQYGYLIGVTVSERSGADQWIVETRQKGGDWTNAGSFTGKTADVVIAPLAPGEPELVDVRVRLRLKNENYGNVSQTATVTVNP